MCVCVCNNLKDLALIISWPTHTHIGGTQERTTSDFAPRLDPKISTICGD